MVQRTIVELTDDLTGGAADETIRFAFDGKAYAIDLSTKNADKLRKLIRPYVQAARPEPSAPPTGSKGGSNGHPRGIDAAAIRAWASSNGYQVSTRGRISGDVRAAYQFAGN